MKKYEALKQVQSWWGKHGYVEDRGKKAPTEHLKRYVVGTIVRVLLPMKCVKGSGSTWSEAISDVSEDEQKRIW